MVGQRASGSRSLLAPIIGGLAVVAALIAVIFFRAQLWDGLKWLGGVISDWLTEWVPDHPGQTAAIVGFAVLAFVLNWLAHVRGRLRAWIFALVVEFALWLLFWYGAGIPPLNELLGLNIDRMSAAAVLSSGLIVIAVTGAIFWWLEAREEWRKYKRRHDADD
jgi:hypothetical protein